MTPERRGSDARARVRPSSTEGSIGSLWIVWRAYPQANRVIHRSWDKSPRPFRPAFCTMSRRPGASPPSPEATCPVLPTQASKRPDRHHEGPWQRSGRYLPGGGVSVPAGCCSFAPAVPRPRITRLSRRKEGEGRVQRHSDSDDADHRTDPKAPVLRRARLGPQYQHSDDEDHRSDEDERQALYKVHRLSPRSWTVRDCSASWGLSPSPWSRPPFGPVAHATHPEPRSRITGLVRGASFPITGRAHVVVLVEVAMRAVAERTAVCGAAWRGTGRLVTGLRRLTVSRVQCPRVLGHEGPSCSRQSSTKRSGRTAARKGAFAAVRRQNHASSALARSVPVSPPRPPHPRRSIRGRGHNLGRR